MHYLRSTHAHIDESVAASLLTLLVVGCVEFALHELMRMMLGAAIAGWLLAALTSAGVIFVGVIGTYWHGPLGGWAGPHVRTWSRWTTLVAAAGLLYTSTTAFPFMLAVAVAEMHDRMK